MSEELKMELTTALANVRDEIGRHHDEGWAWCMQVIDSAIAFVDEHRHDHVVDTSKMLVIELGSGGIGIAVGKSRGSAVMDTLVFAELQDEHSIGAPVRANPRNVCAIIKCANIESAKVLKMQVDTVVNALCGATNA